MYRLPIALLLLVGCSYLPERPLASVSTAQEQLHQVVETCEKIRIRHQNGATPVSCRIWFPHRLHLEFPDFQTYQSSAEPVAKMVHTWCQGVREVEGRRAMYSWEYTRDGSAFSRRCPPASEPKQEE